MEQLSVFDIIKIGIGPSSSHTMGPWTAASRFVSHLESTSHLAQTKELFVDLYGSLAKTGVGHGTDKAVQMGLAGHDYTQVNQHILQRTLNDIVANLNIRLQNHHLINFDPKRDIIFHFDESLPEHPNGMKFTAVLQDETIIQKTYFSVGGGFVQEEKQEIESNRSTSKFIIDSAKQITDLCLLNKWSFSQLVFEKEKSWFDESSIKNTCNHLWKTILKTVHTGCHSEGILPGGLKVSRRASRWNKDFFKNRVIENEQEWLKEIAICKNNFDNVLAWVSTFALATNEENAGFGRVVTAPTNGAAGVIPAVLLYHFAFGISFDTEKASKEALRFLLVAGEIGALFKKKATISAALGGCQAEIGVSSAMAAAGLTEVKGGSVEQCLMAAEIAMEHHLGLTCDPVGGLVQIPCIERNSMGAVKAITASNLALQSEPADAVVSLDSVIQTMWETALDMNSRYKETSEAGLAANISVNVPEC